MRAIVVLVLDQNQLIFVVLGVGELSSWLTRYMVQPRSFPLNWGKNNPDEDPGIHLLPPRTLEY